MEQKYLQVLKNFAEKVRTIYPEARILAFGSHAKGTATKESDLDVCVVLPSFQPDDRLVISDLAWETGFNHEILISTIVISQDEFQTGLLAASPLVQAIRSEGVSA